ncbi:MAG: DUF3536 domain-containing protein [Synergistaceae bacterium]|nr:DUF3536 domain-containing protein [Synergistaceae bacterium]
MPRYVCIHGHFYQPPRENPWLDIIELQESASPWHDWNDRITAECYRRNAASRILDNDGNIRKICNNYSRMSFNIGPTLMSWLKKHAPRSYGVILNADKEGAERFSGHGPALAQGHSHLIMPLANRRDKVTQVKWGIADFKNHFGRMPEGMWLAETAVDTETLEVLAENGILFTVLAPKQASEVRPLKGGGAWNDVKWGKVDTGMAYRCNLPSGKSIDLFFYDGTISHDIAFGGLLYDGSAYAKRLIDAKPEGARSTLSHVVTDGESYGHHHSNGDMALAYCFEAIDSGHEATLTIYGEFLEKYPPTHEARIVENSAWSCAHGLGRWSSDCGCSAGTPGWHQKWRAPLRDALNWLRDKLAVLYEHGAGQYLKAPWEARDDYISVILDRTPKFVDNWLLQRASRKLTEEEKTKVLKLLESQKGALLMFTSCGWFFDDVSGLETVQILRYASYAISLMRDLTGLDFEPEFMRLLEKAPSNVHEYRNGKRVYELAVKPSQVSFERVAAHYGLSVLFADLTSDIWEEFSGGCWELAGDKTICKNGVSGSQVFATGSVSISSMITREKKNFVFAANHHSETNVACGIALQGQEDPLFKKPESLRAVFAEQNEKKLADIFEQNVFSLRHILNYAQRAMLNKLLEQDVRRIETSLNRIVGNYHGLFDYLATLNMKAPPIIRSSAGVLLTAGVERALKEEFPDVPALRLDMERSRLWNAALDQDQISSALLEWTGKQMQAIYESPTDAELMDTVRDVLELFARELNWQLDLYEAQNLYYATQTGHTTQTRQIASGLRASFRRLGKALKFADEALVI